MADTLSKDERSRMMSRIRSTDTKPERIVRSSIHRLGYRFRLHDGRLPGSPDIVLPRLQTVVFVHGCFWHRHQGCRFAYIPKSRIEFWKSKFAANKKRDKIAIAMLEDLGWHVIVVWECETRNLPALNERLRTELA